MTESEARPEARGTLGTVRNAMVLLDLLSEGPAFQHLNDLAVRSGMSVATVHRLLRSLVLADLVEQDPRSARYGLGPGATRLSERYLGRLPVLGALAPYLVGLQQSTARTVRVALLVRGSAVYVDRVDGPDTGLFRDAHRVRPALETAAGRVLAAGATTEAWQQALSVAEPPLREQAEREREHWRKAHYLTAAEPETSAAALELAVGVCDTPDHPAAALAVTVQGEEEDIQPLVRQLTQAASAAARTLGHV